MLPLCAFLSSPVALLLLNLWWESSPLLQNNLCIFPTSATTLWQEQEEIKAEAVINAFPLSEINAVKSVPIFVTNIQQLHLYWQEQHSCKHGLLWPWIISESQSHLSPCLGLILQFTVKEDCKSDICTKIRLADPFLKLGLSFTEQPHALIVQMWSHIKKKQNLSH